MNGSTVFIIFLILSAIITIIAHFRSIRKYDSNNSKGFQPPLYPCKKYLIKKVNDVRQGYIVYEDCKGIITGIMVEGDIEICLKKIINNGGVIIEEIEFCN